jgi:HAD superfamily hydrolase (TIGR01509 family)
MNFVTNLSRSIQNKELLIFDFDGTVADTAPFHELAFNTVIKPFGLVIDYTSVSGMSTVDALRSCFSSAGQERSNVFLRGLAASKQTAVRQLISRGLSPMPGVESFLGWAKSRFGIALATSGSRRTVTLSLEVLGYLDCFDPIICAEDVENTKPFPDPFIAVLDRVGVSSDKALVFEDSEAGFISAHRAGIEVFDARRNIWTSLQCGDA